MNQPPSPYDIGPGESIHRRPERPINLYLLGVIGVGVLAVAGIACLCLVASSVIFLKPPPTPAAISQPTSAVIIPTGGVLLQTQTSFVGPTPILPTAALPTTGNQAPA